MVSPSVHPVIVIAVIKLYALSSVDSEILRRIINNVFYNLQSFVTIKIK